MENFKFRRYFSHSFWHQSCLTYSVGIVSSTNSQPKQHFEQLAPVQSLHVFGLCPRYGWRCSELVNSEGLGSYLTVPEVVWISPKVFDYFSRSVAIHGYRLLSQCFKNGYGLNIVRIVFISFSSAGIIAFFAFCSSSRAMEAYEYFSWTFLRLSLTSTTSNIFIWIVALRVPFRCEEDFSCFLRAFARPSDSEKRYIRPIVQSPTITLFMIWFFIYQLEGGCISLAPISKTSSLR